MNIMNVIGMKKGTRKTVTILGAVALALLVQAQAVQGMDEVVSDDEALSMSEGSQIRVDGIFDNMGAIIAGFEAEADGFQSQATQSLDWLCTLAGLNVSGNDGLTDFAPSNYNINNEVTQAGTSVFGKAMALGQKMTNFQNALELIVPKLLRNKEKLVRNKGRAQRRQQQDDQDDDALLQQAMLMSLGTNEVEPVAQKEPLGQSGVIGTISDDETLSMSEGSINAFELVVQTEGIAEAVEGMGETIKSQAVEIQNSVMDNAMATYGDIDTLIHSQGISKPEDDFPELMPSINLIEGFNKKFEKFLRNKERFMRNADRAEKRLKLAILMSM